MNKYKHKEAYCLMQYACNCGHYELIWNSRDGVTPFGTNCPSCGKPTLKHINWNNDIEFIDYKLNNRQRFWRDGTKEDAIKIINKKVELAKSYDRIIPQEIIDTMIDNVNNDCSDEFHKGWPILDEYRV